LIRLFGHNDVRDGRDLHDTAASIKVFRKASRVSLLLIVIYLLNTLFFYLYGH